MLNPIKRWYYCWAVLATQIAFKNCEIFIKCVSGIAGTTNDDVEDLDLVIP